MAKKLKNSVLRNFTNQYRHKYLGEFLYIECPMICTSFLKSYNWHPKDEYIAELNIELEKLGTSITMACFYSRVDKCYFVVSHVWVPFLYMWAPTDIKMYIEKINTTMLKYAYRKDIEEEAPVKKESYAEKQKDVTEAVQITEKKSLFLEKIKDDVYRDDFFKKYGLNLDTYEAMCKDSNVIVEDFEEETHILKMHKFLFNKYSVLLRDTMKVLNDNGIILQDKNDPNYKTNYFLAKEFVAYGFGYNEHDAERNTTYPVLYKKGLFTILLLLHDSGILNKQVIPNLSF